MVHSSFRVFNVFLVLVLLVGCVNCLVFTSSVLYYVELGLYFWAGDCLLLLCSDLVLDFFHASYQLKVAGKYVHFLYGWIDLFD